MAQLGALQLSSQLLNATKLKLSKGGLGTRRGTHQSISGGRRTAAAGSAAIERMMIVNRHPNN